jgi:hypothetical protein
VYRAGSVISLNDSDVSAWLIEATLMASGAETGLLQTIVNSPTLFPFELHGFHINHLRHNERLEYFRQGIDQDVLMLRRNIQVQTEVEAVQRL